MTDTLIDRNSEILGGTPVFAGTRVPVRILMQHLEAGDRGIEHQQNVSDLPLPVIIMLGVRNRLAELQPLVPG